MKGYAMAFCDGIGCDKVGMWKQYFDDSDTWVLSMCDECRGAK